MSEAAGLTYQATTKILAKLGDATERIVLVGGQAVNFWANYFAAEPDIKNSGAYANTSKDIDFATREKATLTACALRLGGVARVASMDDMNTPSFGVVTCLDDSGVVTIDFLATMVGVKEAELFKTAVKVEIDREDGTFAANLWVMHPTLMLESRAHNVIYLKHLYDNEHGHTQLRTAIVCAREYERAQRSEPNKDVTKERALQKATCKYNRRVFDLAQYGPGPKLFVHCNIDVLDALVLDRPVPEAHLQKDMPNRMYSVRRARKLEAESLERARARLATRDNW